MEQAITWTNIDPFLYHNIVSLVDNELSVVLW